MMLEVQVSLEKDEFYIMNAGEHPISYNDFRELRMRKAVYKRDNGWYIKKEALPYLAEKGYKIRVTS
ncbi:MAG: hypothetical protein QXK74_08470 [Candidatus Nitrosocaldaceae archaeon]